MLQLTLIRTFLKLFLRDRQALFFSLFFPILFMVIFGFVSDAEPVPIAIGVANTATDDEADRQADNFINSLQDNPAFAITRGDEQPLRQQLMAGELDLVLIIPAQFGDGAPADLQVLVDAAQVQQQSLILPVLEQGLVEVERELRDQSALFRLQVEDVEARSQRYIDFLVPGLLAMSLLTLSLAGSAFNIVEYRRKGILKRLFVTPLQPRDFIIGLVVSRALICIVELALLLTIAWLYLDVMIKGNPLTLLLITIAGAAVFLSLGFCVGSLAKSQQTVGALGNLVIFPQIFLSGIFYPIDSLPAFLQPVASLLPLSFVADAMRAVMIDGAGLLQLLPEFIGLSIWLVVMLSLAIRLFVWKDIAA